MFLLTLLYFITFLTGLNAVVNEHQTTFLDEKVLMTCKSSFAPIWEWYGKNDKKNLAVGINIRKNFIDNRLVEQDLIHGIVDRVKGLSKS